MKHARNPTPARGAGWSWSTHLLNRAGLAKGPNQDIDNPDNGDCDGD
jgi:hypothetical protein